MASQYSIVGSHPMTLCNESRTPTRSTSPITQPVKRTHPATSTAQAEDYIKEMTLLRSSDPLMPLASPMDKQGPVHHSLQSQMAKDILAASEAQAKDTQDNRIVATDMLDQIKKSLEYIRKKGLRGVLVLREAIEKLVQNYIKGELSPSTKPTVLNRQTDKAQTYANIAATATPTPIPKRPLPNRSCSTKGKPNCHLLEIESLGCRAFGCIYQDSTTYPYWDSHYSPQYTGYGDPVSEES
ncbi:hypothetical protein VTO42DRAFT_3550 [Malbranchea cinnamomea]